AAGSTLADGRRVPLVYDTLELWSGRPREHRPTPLQDRRERRLELRQGDRADAVLTVGDGVADALHGRYGWDHVSVVRNTFPAAARPPTPPDAPAGLVYPGRLAADRELETVSAATRDPGLPLPVTLVGPADETWRAGFDPGLATVRAPVGTDELTDLLTRAGLALVTHSDAWENHRLALPNKLFHAVRAGVPVVATDVGELARTVRRHDLGTLYRPGDPHDLARAVREAVDRFGELRDAVAAAAPALSWEQDEAVLLGVYRRLAARPGHEGDRDTPPPDAPARA
ncbi:MAG TPA: glycosyltransferase, partial [Ornithinimicrobium sp.]|nr:glycosyltransferase [Ornithinimicrobium sp.]